MEALQKQMDRRLLGWRANNFLKAFFYGLGLSFLVFLPFVIVDNGYFLYYGDFNVQQVPFYQMCHDAIRSGNIGWSWTTDLGANFIGSYSFYLLGSPFFWLTIPFPSEAVPYLMAPLLVLKFACASLTGFVYLRRYVRRESWAVVGGLLYAFSGFSVYNVFFNHFHEAIIMFPLMLAALDEYMETRRRGVFALAVFGCCFINYYFFVGQVAFCLIYWFVRMFAGSWRIGLRDFLLLALEAVLGVAMSGVLLVPSVLAVLQNPRVDNPPEGWNALLYDRNQRYLHIIECFFFPPDIPARPNFTPDSGSKWASLGAWLPLFGMTGVIAWLQMHRRHWVRRILGICFLMAMVPILNSAFQLFNSSYYARWFYMITLMMSLATILSLESNRVDWKRAIKWNTAIVLAIALSVGLMPYTEEQDGVTVTLFGLEDYPSRLWSYFAISMLCLGLLAVIFRFRKRNPRLFRQSIAACLAGTCVLYSIFVLALGKTQTENAHDHLIPYSLNGGEDVDVPGGLENCRSDFYEATDNAGMFWQIPNIQAFHSIVPGSIMEFYPSIGVTRDVGSRPEISHYGLRALVSCKWLFDDDHDSEYFGGVLRDNPQMPGWTFYENQNGFDVWENEYYIPMGFSYDYCVSRDTYNATSESDRELLMLKALVLENEDVEKYSDILPEITDTSNLSFTEEAYFDDCIARRETSCTSFSRDNEGFSAVSEGEKERLVFFSVPYEDGWSATVNGEEAEIIKVNVGFMAVKVPAGEADIRFTYRTPGLFAGLLLTGGSVLVLIAYLLLARYYRKKKAKPAPTPVLRAASSRELKEHLGLTLPQPLRKKKPAPHKEPDLPDLP